MAQHKWASVPCPARAPHTYRRNIAPAESFAADKLLLVVLDRPRGVTVNTLDSESNDRGSNPRKALPWLMPCQLADTGLLPLLSFENVRSPNKAGPGQRLACSHARFPARPC